jgi:hypothetical protein
MKLRPQFNLRFRSAEQFELVMGEAAREDISMNEYILRGLEGFYVVLKGQRIAAERAEELNGKEKVAEVAAEKAGEIGRENRPSGIQSDRVGGKGGSVRAPKKGFEVGNNAEIATGGSAGVAAAGISPEGKRGVQKVVAGDHGKLLRGQSVSGAAAAKAGAGGNAEAVDMRAVKMKRLDKLVDMVREEHRVRPYPDDPIETDAVGTTGCKVTVSRPMAGRPAHAGNCQCLTCKPPKEK